MKKSVPGMKVKLRYEICQKYLKNGSVTMKSKNNFNFVCVKQDDSYSF